MQKYFNITRRANLILAALILVSVNCVAQAQEVHKASFKENKEPIAVNVLVGQSRVINFDRPVGRFSVSNPEIAEAVLVTPDQVIVNGKAFGQVNFIAWEQGSGSYLVFDVYVRTNLSLIDSQIRALFPKEDIRLSQANGSVVLSGSTSDVRTVAQVQSVVEAAGFKVVNMLASPVKNATQVQLQVRVAEVSRNKLRDLGTSYAYQGAPGGGAYLNSGNGPSQLSSPGVSPLNGILGGALGGYAYDRFMRRPDNSGGGTYSDPGAQGGGSGGSFDSPADTSDFGAHGHLPPGVALLLAGVLGMLLAVIDAPGRRMQQRNAAPKSPDLTPSAAPHSHDGVGGRIRPARQPADHQAGRPSRPGTRQRSLPPANGDSSGRPYTTRKDQHAAFCEKTFPPRDPACRRIAGGRMRGDHQQLDRQLAEPDRDRPGQAQRHGGPRHPAAGHRFRGARRLLRHQPDLALGPAGRPCPGRPDRIDRALLSPPLGSRVRLAVQARRRVCKRLGPA
jgi:hypothetical protein